MMPNVRRRGLADKHGDREDRTRRGASQGASTVVEVARLSQQARNPSASGQRIAPGIDGASESETTLPFQPSIALPSTGSWLVTGTVWVKWPSNPAGGAFLVQVGFSHAAGSVSIAKVEQSGAWDEAVLPWSFTLVAGEFTGPYAMVASHYAIDPIGTPDEVGITARWSRIA